MIVFQIPRWLWKAFFILLIGGMIFWQLFPNAGGPNGTMTNGAMSSIERYAAKNHMTIGGNPPAAGITITAVAGDYTPETWAVKLLEIMKYPQTPDNVKAIVAWEQAEGGHWNNEARYNPLNTTQSEPESSMMNCLNPPSCDQGVRVYVSWVDGFDATVRTLKNGLYNNILAQLSKGNCAQCVADAVGNSVWGTSKFKV